MTPRGLLTTIGATALGFGLVIGGSPAIPDVFAQAATPPAAQVPAQTEQQQKADFDAQRAQAYDSFVAALAGELGDDQAAVDAAIRTVLKQQIDERQAAGTIELEQAAAMKAVIDVSKAPLFSGFDGQEGMHGFEGHDGRHGRDGRDGYDGRGSQGDGNDQNEDDSSASLPVDNASSNQSASASAAPAQVVTTG